MGVDLSALVKPVRRVLEDFRGKILAIDAFNTLYQFLAIIRQPDGTPLHDRQGRVTSHLSGLIYRTSNFVGAGIKPVFVFDGEAPRRKARKLPRKNVWVEVSPEEINLETTLKDLGVTREQLVDLGILVGTDFNEGVRGIGPKKALAAIKKHGRTEGLLAELDVEIEGLDEVRAIFLEPRVAPFPHPTWRPADPGNVKAMLCGEFDFSPERIDQALAKFEVA